MPVCPCAAGSFCVFCMVNKFMMGVTAMFSFVSHSIYKSYYAVTDAAFWVLGWDFPSHHGHDHDHDHGHDHSHSHSHSHDHKSGGEDEPHIGCSCCFCNKEKMRMMMFTGMMMILFAGWCVVAVKSYLAEKASCVGKECSKDKCDDAVCDAKKKKNGAKHEEKPEPKKVK